MGGSGKKPGNSPTTDYYHVKLTFFISLLSWPITYFLNTGFGFIDQTHIIRQYSLGAIPFHVLRRIEEYCKGFYFSCQARPFWMMAGGFLVLASIVVATTKLSRIHDWLYYGMTLFAFSCVIDLIISLEFNGLISNFMSEYLKLGEPYLSCPFGSAIALFDGIGFYAMYHLIVYLFANGKSWRSTGIYWGAGIINSMVVLLLGVFTGKHSPTFCTFMNVPYVVFPIVVLFRAFGKERRPDWNQSIKSGFLMKIFDLVLAAGFIASTWVFLAKGLGALNCQAEVVLKFLQHEPALHLDNPAPYGIIQALIYLFYFVPIQCISLYYTLKSSKPQFLWEMGLIHAGTMLQAQFSFIGMALDPQTPQDYQSSWTDLTFWAVNLVVLVVPHLYLFRLLPHRQCAKLSQKQAKKVF